MISKVFRSSVRTSRRNGFAASEGELFLEDGPWFGPAGSRGSVSSPYFLSSPRIWQPMRSRLSRLATHFRTLIKVPLSNPPPTRPIHVSPYRHSPPRSFSSPTLWTQNSTANSGNLGGLYSTSFAPPRSSTPPVYRPETPQSNGHFSTSPYSLPRSRNNSQMNLTALVTRQPISRSGSSGQQTPTYALHDGE